MLLHLLHVLLLLHMLLRHLLLCALLRHLLHTLLLLLDLLYALLLLEVRLRVLLRYVLVRQVRIPYRSIHRSRVCLRPIRLRRPRLVRYRGALTIRLYAIPVSIRLHAITVPVRIPYRPTIDRLRRMDRRRTACRAVPSETRIAAIRRRIRYMRRVYRPKWSTRSRRFEASSGNRSGVKRDPGMNARTKFRSMRHNYRPRKCGPRRSGEVRAFKPPAIECLVGRMEAPHIHSFEPGS